MSKRTAEASKAVRAAWKRERELVLQGTGTRDWTPEQQQDIFEKGKAYDENGVAFHGQHMKSVSSYPEYQGDPGNIQFLTRKEHLEAHDGCWRNPTNWYFNCVTKKKLHFGNGPYIPCKTIKLLSPLFGKFSKCESPPVTITEIKSTSTSSAGINTATTTLSSLVSVALECMRKVDAEISACTRESSQLGRIKARVLRMFMDQEVGRSLCQTINSGEQLLSKTSAVLGETKNNLNQYVQRVRL
ncbi:TPA: hypothetical protein ACGO35_001822 [Streptococcus suis]